MKVVMYSIAKQFLTFILDAHLGLGKSFAPSLQPAWPESVVKPQARPKLGRSFCMIS